MEPIKTEGYKNHKIKVFIDPDPQNPREWDNLGTITTCHPNHQLGDIYHNSTIGIKLKGNTKYYPPNQIEDQSSKWGLVQNTVWLPVYAYEHGLIALSTVRNYPFSCKWDSYQLGYIYVEKERIKKGFEAKSVGCKLREKVTEILRQEIRTYSKYLSGDVYGYTSEKDGEVVDSCWGFIGDIDYCLEAAKENINYENKQAE